MCFEHVTCSQKCPCPHSLVSRITGEISDTYSQMMNILCLHLNYCKILILEHLSSAIIALETTCHLCRSWQMQDCQYVPARHFSQKGAVLLAFSAFCASMEKLLQDFELHGHSLEGEGSSQLNASFNADGVYSMGEVKDYRYIDMMFLSNSVCIDRVAGYETAPIFR